MTFTYLYELSVTIVLNHFTGVESWLESRSIENHEKFVQIMQDRIIWLFKRWFDKQEIHTLKIMVQLKSNLG
jgi:hypothetical protein